MTSQATMELYRRLRFSMAILLAAFVCETYAQAAPFAYVADQAGNSVSVIDTGVNTLIATVPVGSEPTGVAITPNGGFAYVTNYGGSTVSVIATATNTVVANVTVGSQPLGIAATPNGAFVYVANWNSGTVSVISTATRTVTATITVGSTPYGVAISPGGAFAYVSYFNAIAIISTSTNTVVSTAPVPAVEAMAFTPNGSYVYAVCASCGNISVIATATNTVVATISDPPGPSGIAISPDGTLAYVTNPLTYDVIAISTASNSIISTINAGSLGATPQDVAMTPDGAFAYVTYYNSPGLQSVVYVVEVASNTVVASIPAGSGSVGIAITSTPPQPPPVAIGEYAVPTLNNHPQGITEGPDGALWFTEFNGNRIGRLSASGATTEYPLPTSGAGPLMITAGPDGALWFTEYTASKIGRITTAGVITEYPTLFSGSGPWGITTGSNGALWVTEFNLGRIAEITTAGVLTERNVYPGFWTGITAGPDGALWFTGYPNYVGRITTAGASAVYNVNPNSYPQSITAGLDGALWFTESSISASAIGRITTGGTLTEHPLAEICAGPDQIAKGPDGALWFTESGSTTCAPQIGRITTSAVVTQYPMPATGIPHKVRVPFGISSGPGVTLWFTDQSTNGVGEIVFVTAELGVTPSNGAYGTELTFTGSGFAKNESVNIYAAGIGSPVLTTATANSAGMFTATATTLAAPFGPRLFLGVGGTSGRVGAASFSVTPRLVATPGSGTQGSMVSAQGLGFGADENVMVYWNTPRTLLGVATANVYGSFLGSTALEFTIPAGAPNGTNYIFGVGESTQTVGTAVVTVP